MSAPWNFLATRAALAWVCLLLHSLSLAWFPTLVSAGLACLDEDHRVDLRWNAGRTSLVLRHEPGQPGHRHCPVATLLVSLSQPGEAAQTDHVLGFGSVPEELAPGRCRPVQPALAATPCFASAIALLPPALVRQLLPPAGVPPPAPGLPLFVRRGVELLI